VEEIAKQITIITSHGVEIAAAGIIGIAIFKVLFRYLSVFPIPKKMLSKEKIRVEFGSSVAVALELMLGADVLATAVAPSWNDIGQLAAIAIIKLAMVSFICFSWIDGNLTRIGAGSGPVGARGFSSVASGPEGVNNFSFGRFAHV